VAKFWVIICLLNLSFSAWAGPSFEWAFHEILWQAIQNENLREFAVRQLKATNLNADASFNENSKIELIGCYPKWDLDHNTTEYTFITYQYTIKDGHQRTTQTRIETGLLFYRSEFDLEGSYHPEWIGKLQAQIDGPFTNYNSIKEIHFGTFSPIKDVGSDYKLGLKVILNKNLFHMGGPFSFEQTFYIDDENGNLFIGSKRP